MLGIWFRRCMFFLAFALLMLLQYIFWFGKGGLISVMQLKGLVSEQKVVIADHDSRNKKLMQRIEALRSDPQAIESLARSELGMIKDGETLFRIVH